MSTKNGEKKRGGRRAGKRAEVGYANAHYDELAFWDRRLGTNQTVDETLYFKASSQLLRSELCNCSNWGS